MQSHGQRERPRLKAPPQEGACSALNLADAGNRRVVGRRDDGDGEPAHAGDAQKDAAAPLPRARVDGAGGVYAVEDDGGPEVGAEGHLADADEAPTDAQAAGLGVQRDEGAVHHCRGTRRSRSAQRCKTRPVSFFDT